MAEPGTQPDDDVAAIGAVLDAYAHAYDGHDAEALANVFTDDALLELPNGTQVQGREALTSFATAASARGAPTRHFTANRKISVSGDEASSQSHVAAVSGVGDDMTLLVIGRYDDSLSRTPHGWRISRRNIIALSGDDLPTS